MLEAQYDQKKAKVTLSENIWIRFITVVVAKEDLDSFTDKNCSRNPFFFRKKKNIFVGGALEWRGGGWRGGAPPPRGGGGGGGCYLVGGGCQWHHCF